ncbi:PREDICTED: importin subunit alpha-1b-like [Amphimedon queenslandica]|uniref:Importin subunit alpha n=1 Tax=Amphimedon queenslandica TaxID=400682 RepID=A0A1X7U0B1_AMPQE|nr:PREDICTED: importin subunit alpha-1b-like [Amphimedon queenslandica]|eukprot:XP_019856767.1 PREDICTED: importin subunit alpha-1b-like [Amphimedon queenslandica]
MASAEEDPNGNQGNYLQSSDDLEELSKDSPFDALLYKIREGEEKERITAIRLLRQTIDRHKDSIISSSVVSDLVDCMKPEESTDLQFEAGWLLTNIASGTPEETKSVVDGGAVPRFIQLIESPSDNVREQVIWALGNIVGDGPQFRDIALDYGIVYSLTPIVGDTEHCLSVRRQASWVFSNLCRHKDLQISTEIFEDILPVFSESLIKEQDSTCIKELCWGVSYITDNCSDERLTVILNTSILSDIMRLLRERVDKDIIVPCVRVIGNISTSTDSHTQCIIDNGGLPLLSNLISHEANNVRKEVTWTLSNITAGTQEQKQAVIDEGIIPKVLNILNGDAGVQLKKEAAWVISNLVNDCTVEQGSYVVSHGGLHALGNYLSVEDGKMKAVALEGIQAMLRIGDRKKDEEELESNPYLPLVVEIEDDIKQLMDGGNREVSGIATGIYLEYFEEQEDSEKSDNMNDDINSNM